MARNTYVRYSDDGNGEYLSYIIEGVFSSLAKAMENTKGKWEAKSDRNHRGKEYWETRNGQTIVRSELNATWWDRVTSDLTEQGRINPC